MTHGSLHCDEAGRAARVFPEGQARHILNVVRLFLDRSCASFFDAVSHTAARARAPFPVRPPAGALPVIKKRKRLSEISRTQQVRGEGGKGPT